MFNLLKDERGQMMPFLAISLMIMLAFAAWMFGKSYTYLQRTKVRDAADAAATAALAIAENRPRPTYYGECKVRKTDKDGHTYWVWEKFERNYRDYVVLDQSEAERLAREYFEKNLQLSGFDNYRILEFDVSFVKERGNVLQVEYRRPATEGINRVYEEVFPRWVRAKVSARVEIPVPLGDMAGRKTMTVAINSGSQKAVPGVIPPRETGRSGYYAAPEWR